MAITQERGKSGQFPDITQDRVPVPGPDVPPVGSDERVALAFGEPEPDGLQRGDEVDFPGPGANRVPVGEYDTLSVAEQVPPVRIAMNHPSRARSFSSMARLEAIARLTETSGR